MQQFTNFKSIRKKNNLKQDELAKIINIARSNIALVETGKLKPNLNMLLAYSNYFKVSTDYLLGLKETEN